MCSVRFIAPSTAFTSCSVSVSSVSSDNSVSSSVVSVTGWEDAVGQLLTADKDGKFYSVTLNGNFTGFLFLDYADPSKNTAGQGFVSTMKAS